MSAAPAPGRCTECDEPARGFVQPYEALGDDNLVIEVPAHTCRQCWMHCQMERHIAADVWPAARRGELADPTGGHLTSPAADPADCLHDQAVVEAYIGNPGAEDPQRRGLPWEMLEPQQRDLDGVAAYVALGVCPRCGCRVVSVRSWDRSGDGPTFTSRWSRLVRDGATPR